MDLPPSRLPKPSGLPRASKLPPPRGFEEGVPQDNPIKPAFNDRSRLKTYHPGRDWRPAKAEGGTSAQAINRVGFSLKEDPDLASETTVAEEAESVLKAQTQHRRPRPSLSDRTIETLSQIPPSPSPQRRKSSFFALESPFLPSSRPTSSLSRSRPSTSHGQYPPLPSGIPTSRPASPTKRPLVPCTSNQIPNVTPSKRAVSSYVPRSLPHHASNAKLRSDVDSTPSKSKPSVPSDSLLASDMVAGKPKSSLKKVSGSKTLAARPFKQRPSVHDAFAKPAPKTTETVRNKTAQGQRKVSSTSLGTTDAAATLSPLSKKTSQTSSEAAEPRYGVVQSPKSSAALRETIAKAKAAQRNASKFLANGSTNPKPGTENFLGFEIGGSSDDLLRKRIASARADGRLNIAAMGLKDMPHEVLNMYNANVGDGAWYENVDLVRFIAADNEFEYFENQTFPDDNAASHSTDDYQGNLFGGLETLDLHGNHLKAVPIGLRRLDRLTTLNLSKNRLHNDCLEVISQVGSLRELRLADNALEGMLSSELCSLRKLETLDVQNNALTTLPSDLDQISSLRALHIDGNRFASLPFECFIGLPLIELSAARNRLSGSLFPSSVDRMPQLKSLDVANNALTSIVTIHTVELPALQSLNVTENRLTNLPDVLDWTELVTLIAGGNKLCSLPEGITSLQKLKAADFSRNDIKKLDESIGLMENLTVLRVANNPLRERKFLIMETGEMKRELRSRLLPVDSAEADGEGFLSYDGSGSAAGGKIVNFRLWPVKSGGVLDRSSTNLEAIDRSDLEPLVETSDIKIITLHHNLLSQIPQALAVTAHTLMALDISHNKLNNSYLLDALELPNLKSLNLSTNAMISVFPLFENLSAPKLAELNLSRNRLAVLPNLRDTFPALTTLFASDNIISDLQVESVRGLHVLDVSGNEIAYLEPKLGLLGTEGLTTLMVGGNRFRVPRREVVDKGTGAILAYLKSRIPDNEMQSLA